MNTTHTMKPLKIYNTDETEPSACHRITCAETGASARWNDASRARWVSDGYDEVNRKLIYLSPEGQAIRSARLKSL